MERTLVLVKPDGVQRGLVGDIVGRLERRGLHLIGLKLMQIDEALAARHYAEHVAKPFYPGLVRFITSGPVVAMVWRGRAPWLGPLHDGCDRPGEVGAGHHPG